MNNNKNNQVTPITPIKLAKNNNSSDPGWTVTKSNNKRKLSTSTSFKPPTSPTIQTTAQKSKNKKKNSLRETIMKFSFKTKIKLKIPPLSLQSKLTLILMLTSKTNHLLQFS